ncbi:MAG: SWIM zinc finger family protein [Chloroflexi bacterium]|nr:SWIM zinc finger family protein [Chloroflexota bacterium]
MILPKLTESIIRAAATPQSFERGQDYYQRDAISNPAVLESTLMGDCEGTQSPYYRVRVTLDSAGIRAGQCTCPYEGGGLCKHVVALLLTYAHHPKRFVVRQEPSALLAELDRDALIILLTQLLRERPELYDVVEAAIAKPEPTGKRGKARRQKVDADVYRRQVIGILHSLDGMRASEAYWHVDGLTGQLDQVLETAVKFLDAEDPETALEILLALVEEAGRAIEYIDDSDGYFGDFMSGLGQPLAEVVLSLDLSAVQRDALVRRIEAQTRYLSDYGMDEGLDLAIRAARAGWDTESAPASNDIHRGRDTAEEEADEEEPAYFGSGANPFGDLTDAKLNVLKRQGRTADYLALCKQTDRHLRYALMLCDLERVPEAITYATRHFDSAPEAHALAAHLRELGHIDDAIAMGERGLNLAGAKLLLAQWLAPIEEAQGRTQPALRAWQAAFAEHPTLTAYETLKRLAGTSWRKLQPQVMQALRMTGTALTLAQVLLVEEAWDEAITVAERRDAWYDVIETVADGVIGHRAEWVAQMSIKQAERLMERADSSKYVYAANWLTRAKDAYTRLDQASEWQAYLEKVKQTYKRRPALQAQLRRL